MDEALITGHAKFFYAKIAKKGIFLAAFVLALLAINRPLHVR